ncbi:MAG: NUDIX hydrolase [Candidatus Sericytochromatia bacterium]|nr:NUDIX hydrolase [Candidatus Sericytochromatia bacterium]
MKHCPACGAPTHLRIPPGDNRERAVCSSCSVVHYENPRIVVGAVCHTGDRLALCRRAIPPRIGYWTFPAGFLEMGETAEEGAAREAREEAGVEVVVERLLGVYSVPGRGQVHLLYEARMLGEAHEAGEESLEVVLRPWVDIPWGDLAFPSIRWGLQLALEARDQPGWVPRMTAAAGAPDLPALPGDLQS